MIAIVGPNGAGKSTLMKALFGLLRPSGGRIFFQGTDVTGFAPERLVRLGLSYVPQVDNVFPTLTVEENLEMGGFVTGGDLRERKARVYRLFPLLAERRHQRVGRMSGGERQMVAMGRALMQAPSLLLLDEPSAGLAPRMVDTVFEQIRAIHRTGVAVVMVEQNARRALETADRAYVLVGGRNRWEGPARALLGDRELGRLYLGG
ncbi:MAG: ABC transporter ATP-binding protein [Limnochordaceae bacterium]|nr:ABC transporter ATP-binding protein [Limnochordaceae bacterium]